MKIYQVVIEKVTKLVTEADVVDRSVISIVNYYTNAEAAQQHMDYLLKNKPKDYWEEVNGSRKQISVKTIIPLNEF